MTLDEMHMAFGMYVDGYDTLNYIDISPEEKDFWLNQAILVFSKERFSGKNNTGFEETQKRIEDLRVLIENADLTPTGPGNKPNSYLFALPNDYWIADEEEVGFTVAGMTNMVRAGITECSGDSYRSSMDNPFSEHRLKYNSAKPLRTFLGENVELVTDGTYAITHYYLRYLRKPATVDSLSDPPIDCDLNEFNHDEIVQMAVRMAVASLSDREKYQLRTIEESKNVN